MVNGNYILYGDKPYSESEIVDDHVHPRTAERKAKRKANRTANELQRSLNLAQLDNETDSVKYEKKIKEPRLLRYVPTSDVEEHFVTEKFETYDLKPTEQPPRRCTFTKKPKNPADGSTNYAYSRSSSSCSSPNGNLPTISEHGEQYGTYRIRAVQVPADDGIINGYENKLEKYFARPREVKAFTAKGSHPDSLYRVATGGGVASSKLVRALRLLRWPIALFAVCVALAVFVYFLMPSNMEADINTVNATFWEESIVSAQSHSGADKSNQKHPDIIKSKKIESSTRKNAHGMKTSEIDFYEPDVENNLDFTSIVDTITESTKRKLPVPPVFPSHISPEVQYGNEKADSEKSRSPKLLEDTNTVPNDSTFKPHITQKPEKPLAIYFKDGNGITTTSTEAATRIDTITRAEPNNDYGTFDEKQMNKNYDGTPPKISLPVYKESPVSSDKIKKDSFSGPIVVEQEVPLDVQEFYGRPAVNPDVKFTSGHSNLFGISIEDAEKMKSTTQSSVYNTRVSPTLPTWRDGDDSTTKKYPISVNSDVPQCRSTRIPLCRGVLPYDLAGSPAKFNGVEVTSLLSQIEYLVATNCSDRVKHFACALLEPECSPPPYSSKMPCYNLCKAIVDYCEGYMPRELSEVFSCNQYSSSRCVTARSPCYERELTCGDGSCVPRDWVCDGTRDCPGGEDEAACAVCEQNEFRCHSGSCIFRRWICDGYTDCPTGEDEAEELCGPKRSRKFENEAGELLGDELGEEPAGSAPAPSIRRPNRVGDRTDNLHRIGGEYDSSKELLETSDTNNAFKRNFTRRPSPSRLTPYTHPMLKEPKPSPIVDPVSTRKSLSYSNHKNKQGQSLQEYAKELFSEKDSVEDVNIGDIGFFGDIEKEKKEETQKRPKVPTKARTTTSSTTTTISPATRLDKSMDKLEKVIDGAAMLRKASQADVNAESAEGNDTIVDKDDYPPMRGSTSAHASPCPSGELRCVDGRCITLAQLCDGTIDCTDHADEDNCYT